MRDQADRKHKQTGSFYMLRYKCDRIRVIKLIDKVNSGSIGTIALIEMSKYLVCSLPVKASKRATFKTQSNARTSAKSEAEIRRIICGNCRQIVLHTIRTSISERMWKTHWSMRKQQPAIWCHTRYMYVPNANIIVRQSLAPEMLPHCVCACESQVRVSKASVIEWIYFWGS